MIIKLVLLGAALFAAVWLVSGRRSGSRLALARMSGLTLTVAGAGAIVMPDLVTHVANAVGVGRGADLILYVLVVVFGFTTFSTRMRMRDFEDRLTQLTRDTAVNDVLQASEPSSTTPSGHRHAEEVHPPTQHDED